MIKWYIIFVFSAWTLHSKGVECEVMELASLDDSSSRDVKGDGNTIGSVSDDSFLKGLSPIKVLLNIPTSSKTISNKVKELTVKKLGEFGRVIPKSPTVKRLMEDRELLRSPVLIYEIKNIRDLNGEELPIFEVILTCEASLEVNKNAQYGQGIIWNKQCFVKHVASDDLESLVSQTFPFLLQEFHTSYRAANGNSSESLTFFLVE